MLQAAAAQAEAAPTLGRGVALLRPLLADITWLDAMVADQCAAMAHDPRHLPPIRASIAGPARHLVLVRTERIRIAVTIMDPAPDPNPDPDDAPRVHFSGHYSLYRPLGSRPLTVDAFALEGDMAVACGQHVYPPGMTIDLDERRLAWRIVARHAPALLLRAQIAPPGLVAARLHDARSGVQLSATHVDEGHARTLMMLSLLRMQGRTDAVDRFAAALDSPIGFQRWAVMREWLALDTRSALPALETLAQDDPDADIRRLATRTLDQARNRREIAPCPA